MAKLYSDLGKTAKKLLGDDYIESNKLKVKSSTASGVSYTVQAEQKGYGENIDGDFSLEFPAAGQKATAKLFTSGKGTAEIKLNSLGVKGLNATLLAGIGKEVGTATIEFKHGPAGLTAVYDTINKCANATAAIAVAPQGYAGYCVVAVDGTVSTPSLTADKLDLCLSFFDGAESECALHVTDKGARSMLSYSHHVRSGFSVASQIAYDKPKESAKLTMGGACRLDGVTTIKAKIDSTGLLSTSYIQEIRDKTTLIMSTKFNVTSLDAAKVGISLALD
jgi:voltage-dependent anion channel protein 2